MKKKFFLIFLLLIATGICFGAKTDSITKEFKVTYKNGIATDTDIVSETVYKARKLYSVTTFFRNQIISKSLYLKSGEVKATDYLKKNNVTYVVLTGNKEEDFLNGHLIAKRIYDIYGHLTDNICYSYVSSKKGVFHEKHIYKLKADGEILSDIFFVNKSKINEATYIYDSLHLIKKIFIFNRCCEGNQEIPTDWIDYLYDKNKLSKEVFNINKNIKRDYKKIYDGYFDQVKIIDYIYDDEGRIKEKRQSIPLEKFNLRAESNKVSLFKYYGN
jgi:hypothetical protein